MFTGEDRATVMTMGVDSCNSQSHGGQAKDDKPASSLSQHHFQAVGPGEGRFKCDFCKIVFVGIENITRHVRRHFGER